MLFLTSDVGAITKTKEGKKIIMPLNNTYKFVDKIQEVMIDRKSKIPTSGIVPLHNNSLVFVASNPTDHKNNDYYANAIYKSFILSDIKLGGLEILDSRTLEYAKTIINEASVVFLAGGDPRVQMQFFDEIKLADLLKTKVNSKIIIGQSAGAINMAKEVYCSPDSIEDLGKEVYYPGLGLTKISVEPHFVNTDGFGKSAEMGNHLLKDSKTKPFFALTDGSYIIVDKSKYAFFGEGYLFKDGKYSLVPPQNFNSIVDNEFEMTK